jgi:hypothetical protein
MAICCQLGFGTDIDISRSLELLREAAQAGHEPSCAIVKRLHDAGGHALPANFPIKSCLETGIRYGSQVAVEDLKHVDPEEYGRIFADVKQSRYKILINLERHESKKKERDQDQSDAHIAPSKPVSPTENNVIHDLAMKGDVKGMQELFSHDGQSKATIDSKNENGESPLLLACKHGHYDMFKYLVESGVSRADDRFVAENCLHWITTFEDDKVDDVVESLVDGGMNISARLPMYDEKFFFTYFPNVQHGRLSTFLIAVHRNKHAALRALLHHGSWKAQPFVDFGKMGFPSVDTWTAEQIKAFSLPWPNDFLDVLGECLRSHRVDMAESVIEIIREHPDLFEGEFQVLPK